MGILLAIESAGCSDLGRPVVLQGAWELSGSSLDFGSVALTDSTTRSLTIRNSGNADLVGDAVIPCSDFRLIAGGGSFRIAPGAQHDVVVGFDPLTEGDFTCALELGQGSPPVTLKGTGALQSAGALCTVSIDSLDFGRLTVGQTRDQTFTVHSAGTAALRLNVVSGCAEFEIVSGGGPSLLPAGADLVVTTRFQPNVGGATSCVIAVGPACPEVTVTGFANTVSFATDVQPIFDHFCISCHPTPGQCCVNGSLFLGRTVSYANLVRTPSRLYSYPDDSPALRVVPFSPDSSVLYGKITGTAFGASMPGGGALIPLDARQKILTWILEGANNN